MNVRDFIKQVTVSLHQQAYDDARSGAMEVVELSREISGLSATNEAQSKAIVDLNKTIDQLKSTPPEPPLDAFLSTRYRHIDNIAYKNKEGFFPPKSPSKGVKINVFLNEMITPDVWEVQNLRRKITDTKDDFLRVKFAGDLCARTFTWTDDGQLDQSGDFYVEPKYAIKYKRIDCEDHSFVMASLIPTLGVAYGYYINGATKYGHAFNVLVYENELWIVDTVDDVCYMQRMEGNANYKVHYILTSRKTYELDGSVAFGEVASWG